MLELLFRLFDLANLLFQVLVHQHEADALVGLVNLWGHLVNIENSGEEFHCLGA
jgi:hypothetical protein